MKLPIYQVDAFTRGAFTGNPAAICPLQNWLDNDTLQAIAEENNLAETAFFVPEGQGYRLRWFTPKVEVDLCGHATLATAWVLFNCLRYPEETILFHTRSGELRVSKHQNGLAMNFPADEAESCAPPEHTETAFGLSPSATYSGADLLFIFETEEQIKALKPTKELLMNWPKRGVICSAASQREDVDFVSRFFGPKVGIDEDHATGSAHCTLTPYWSKTLGKTALKAEQLSLRRAFFSCEHQGERVEIIGDCHLYLSGEISI